MEDDIMATVSNDEIRDLYKACGLRDGNDTRQIRQEINSCPVRNKLNTNYLNIYGKYSLNNLSGSTNVKYDK